MQVSTLSVLYRDEVDFTLFVVFPGIFLVVSGDLDGTASAVEEVW